MAGENEAMNQSSSESPVKHTSAGEIPNTSKFYEYSRRVQAAAPVVYDKLKSKAVAIPLLAATLGVAIFFVVKNLNERT